MKKFFGLMKILAAVSLLCTGFIFTSCADSSSGGEGTSDCADSSSGGEGTSDDPSVGYTAYMPEEYANKTIVGKYALCMTAGSASGTRAMFFFDDNTYIVTTYEKTNGTVRKLWDVKGEYIGNFKVGSVLTAWNVYFLDEWTGNWENDTELSSDRLTVKKNSIETKDTDGTYTFPVFNGKIVN